MSTTDGSKNVSSNEAVTSVDGAKGIPVHTFDFEERIMQVEVPPDPIKKRGPILRQIWSRGECARKDKRSPKADQSTSHQQDTEVHHAIPSRSTCDADRNGWRSRSRSTSS